MSHADRIAALSADQRQRLISECGVPRHLVSPPNAPPQVHALELLAWYTGRRALDELSQRLSALEKDALENDNER